MCFLQNSLKRIIAFSAAFLIGFFAVSVYQTASLNDSKNTVTENLTFVDKRPEESRDQNEEKRTVSSGNRESLLDRKIECLDSCRVCECENNSLNERPINSENETLNSNNSKALKILYKPRPLYTKEAKNNNIEGNVRVRVTFLANGEIGAISEVTGLPFGLTEKAFEAAREIKFKPQIMNNKPVSVVKVVVFKFEI